jgi:CheY-like chemotaxis protein
MRREVHVKILIVDDDSTTVNALQAGLVSIGHEVVTASDGAEALREIDHSMDEPEPVELMVTDLIMPGMNGLELIESARKVLPALPVVLITAYGVRQTREQAGRLGRCEYIEKPFGPVMLMKVIDALRIQTALG